MTITAVCPACDGTRICLVASYDEDRNEIEPCMFCEGEGELENVGRDE